MGVSEFRRYGRAMAGDRRTYGRAMIGTAVLLVAALHVTTPAVDPVRDMISDYARDHDGWMFTVAVLLIAAGSGTLLPWRSHFRRRGRRAAFLLYAAWCLGLVTLAACPRDVIGGPPTATGRVHLVAALVALLSLPLATLAAGGTRASRAVAVLVLALLVPLVDGFLYGPPLGDALGLIERAIALADLALVVTTPLTATSLATAPAR